MIVNFFSKKTLGTEIKGVHIGVQNTTVGIRIESFLAVYGEVSYDLNSGEISISADSTLVNSK